MSKKTHSVQLFLFYPQLWLKWSLPTKNEPNRTKIDDLVTKTISVIEKVKPRRARILFLKSVKTCPKRLTPYNCFSFISNYGSSGACPQKVSQIGPKLTIWWPKKSSVIEKVKPHCARILFWISVKTYSKWFALPIFFILSPTMAQVELAHKKLAKSYKNGRYGDQNKVWWSKKLSLMERGYLL